MGVAWHCQTVRIITRIGGHSQEIGAAVQLRPPAMIHMRNFVSGNCPIDTSATFCQTAPMSHLPRKFVAILMLLWLPLFSGNALAVSIAMQAMGSGCHAVVAQQGKPHHRPSTAQQHTQRFKLTADQDQSVDHQDQQNSASNNCGVCHLACCGYLAAASIEVTEAQPPARLFTFASTQFQSFTSAPLDPPPLARA